MSGAEKSPTAAEITARAEALAEVAGFRINRRAIDATQLVYDDHESFEVAVAEAKLAQVHAKLAEARAAQGYHVATRGRPIRGLDRFIGGRYNLDRLTATTSDTPEAIEELQIARGMVNEAA